MVKQILLGLALVSGSVLAGPVVEHHERYGQTVVIVRTAWKPAVVKAADEEHFGRLKSHSWFSVTPWWTRERHENGKLICEKFSLIAPRADEEAVNYLVDWLVAQPCS